VDKDAQDVWHGIDDQRRRLVELLEDLSDLEWRQQSLCAGWTVRQVAAHVALQNMSWSALPRAVPAVIRHRGINEAIHAEASRACRAASYPLRDVECRGGRGWVMHETQRDHREAHPGVVAHVTGLPRVVGAADQHALALEPDPDDPAPRAAIAPQCGEVDVIGGIEERPDIRGNRDRFGLGLHAI